MPTEVQVEPTEMRRTGADGKPVIDLRWTIHEGSPANINKIEIVGNDVTQDHVIRRVLGFYPGQHLRFPEIRIAGNNLARLGIGDPSAEAL